MDCGAAIQLYNRLFRNLLDNFFFVMGNNRDIFVGILWCLRNPENARINFMTMEFHMYLNIEVGRI